MPDVLIDNKKLYNFQIYFLYFFSIVTKSTAILFLIGFFQERPYAIIKTNSIVKFILGLYLIYRFNSYRKHKIEFTDLDRKICYSTGLYIVLLSLGEYILQLSYNVRSRIIVYTLPIIDYVKTLFNLKN
jgi:hypothetical protein